jgi:hypothetical protein
MGNRTTRVSKSIVAALRTTRGSKSVAASAPEAALAQVEAAEVVAELPELVPEVVAELPELAPEVQPEVPAPITEHSADDPHGDKALQERFNRENPEAPKAAGPTLHVKQGLALRGGRGEWYKLLCKYDGKPVADYIADGKANPASHYTARSTKCGQPKTPESRLSWFKRAGIVTIK